MGKLAIQLSLGVMCVACVLALPSFMLPWTIVKSVGVLSGVTRAEFGLWWVRVSYAVSLQEQIVKYTPGNVNKKDSYQLLNMAEKPAAEKSLFRQEPTGNPSQPHAMVIPLWDLYLSAEATKNFKRLFTTNTATGVGWQLGMAFWAGAINALLLIIGLVCALMSAAYLYFYMHGKFNPKLRKIGSYYMAGTLFCMFLAIICYTPVLVFMGQDQHGIVASAIPGFRLFHDKGQVPGLGIFMLVISCILVGGALASQSSWKTESGEWKRERHKMKHEFEKWMETDSSSDDLLEDWEDDEDDDWDAEQASDSSDDGGKKKKKKSKKDKKDKKKKKDKKHKH